MKRYMVEVKGRALVEANSEEEAWEIALKEFEKDPDFFEWGEIKVYEWGL